MADEDHGQLLKFIKTTYQIQEFDPPSAKDYEQDIAEVFKELHAKFVSKGFQRMPRGMTGLDSGLPWFLYWLTHSLEVMNVEGFELTDDQKSRCVQYLARCQNKEGGFGGAPFHLSHIASTYAGILALVNIGTEEAFKMIDVEGMRRFLKSMKNQLKYEKKGQTSGWNLVEQATGKPAVQTKCSEVNPSLPGSMQIH